MTDPVRIDVYRWAGAWGPFRVRIPCGECSLTLDVLDDVLERELAGLRVQVEVRDWLSHWWRPLLRGGWHAPIVLVEGRVVSQGVALDRGRIVEAVVAAWSRRTPVDGTIVFGKSGCPHCVRARQMLERAGIPHRYRDVVAEPAALHEMIARAKPRIGARTPLTVPQIWLDGDWVGGADALCARLSVDETPVRSTRSRAA
jgi:glutaredoxin